MSTTIGLSRRERIEILRARDGVLCFLPDCRKPFEHLTMDTDLATIDLTLLEDITFDHWLPQSRGGTWDVENLRLMHKRCNAIKGDTLPNDDGTLTLPRRETQADRRNALRSQRVAVCEPCQSGRSLEYGEICAVCGSGPMPMAYPQWARAKANECDHDLFWCWSCTIGHTPRRPAWEDVLNAGELDE